MAVCPDHHSAAQHIYRQMYFVNKYGLHIYSALDDPNLAGSLGVSVTPGLTSSTPSSVRVCTQVYTHTPTHLHNKNREMYKTNSLSLPLLKHSPTCQQQALDMDKLKRPHFHLPPTHACKYYKHL